MLRTPNPPTEACVDIWGQIQRGAGNRFVGQSGTLCSNVLCCRRKPVVSVPCAETTLQRHSTGHRSDNVVTPPPPFGSFGVPANPTCHPHQNIFPQVSQYQKGSTLEAEFGSINYFVASAELGEGGGGGQGCIRREGTSEAAPETLRQAVGGGHCPLQMPLKLAPAVEETVARRGLGALEGGSYAIQPWPVANHLPPPTAPCPTITLNTPPTLHMRHAVVLPSSPLANSRVSARRSPGWGGGRSPSDSLPGVGGALQGYFKANCGTLHRCKPREHV